MFDLITQFPIMDENAKLKELQAEAVDESMKIAFDLGVRLVGDPVFEVLDLPVHMYLQLRVKVEEIASLRLRQ